MFDVFYSGLKPGLFGHEQQADSIEHAQQLSRTRYFWWVNYLTDYTGWDFIWEPVPWQAHQRHAWPSQWQPDSGTYLVPKIWDGTETHYRSERTLIRKPSLDNWTNLDGCEFDTSWHPDPADPPYIHQFGTQWWDEGGPKYTVYAAQAIKYQDHPRARLLPRHDNHWHAVEDCQFDYSWRPHPQDPPYVYVFGNQWWPPEIMPTVRYTVPGATQEKFVYEPKATLLPQQSSHWNLLADCEFDYSWVPDPGDPPYIYVFGNQWHRSEIMPTVEYHVPGAVERKYMDWPAATLLPDRNRWTLPDGIDPDIVDFSWVPDPGDPPYIYQFATQHQKTGGPIYTVPGATEVKYLESVQFEIQSGSVPIVEIDHMDGNAGHIANTVKRIRYFDNYKDTLIRLAKSLVGQYEFVWVCSSICDYSNFDFSWYPEKWQATMLHVFASEDQKFGDTFLMHVPTFAERADKKALLEWYSVNFVPRIRVPRRPIPVIKHNYDSHVDAVKNIEFAAPLALFTVDEHINRALTSVPLWRQQVKTITPISKGATAVIVPRSAVGDVQTQLYDYPYIDKTKVMLLSQPLDIVFISNGESNADANFDWLLQVTKANMNSNLNRIHRVDGVNGRVAAYHAAARASTTPWFFAVFAKLHVNRDFDWSWQPDRMQQAKHYIFHAENPVNGLIYGHQAMIAYNKKLVLENPGVGLDFTLDSPHEVVPVLSGSAHYSGSAWSAWRTAFREALKLRDSLPDVENEYRLNQWLGKDNTIEQWSQKGAQDAVEYYKEVDGNFEKLRLSYDWAWLASYAFMKQSLTPDQ
jgi:hypothetical protein